MLDLFNHFADKFKESVQLTLISLFAAGYIVYLSMMAINAFKVDILNATATQWDDKAAPYIVKREVELKHIHDKLDHQGKVIDDIHNILMTSKR